MPRRSGSQRTTAARPMSPWSAPRTLGAAPDWLASFSVTCQRSLARDVSSVPWGVYSAGRISLLSCSRSAVWIRGARRCWWQSRRPASERPTARRQASCELAPGLLCCDGSAWFAWPRQTLIEGQLLFLAESLPVACACRMTTDYPGCAPPRFWLPEFNKAFSNIRRPLYPWDDVDGYDKEVAVFASQLASVTAESQ